MEIQNRRQQVVVVGKPKSMGVALLLTFFFGPLGLLYSSVIGGIVMMVLGVIVGFITLGLGLIAIWVICLIWAVVAVRMSNQKLANAVK